MADRTTRAHEVTVLRDARIPTAEPGATLSADVYLPADAPPVPALVTVLPYRKDAAIGVVLEASLRWMAQRGYACLLVDFRGTGSSDGAMRPPLVAEEADDGVAAIAWAAAQPWCDGSVGMWGHSYGSIMTMRTASRRPAALKAIVPSVGMLDPERDFVHPYGVRGAQAAIPLWCTDNLANQLLPPLDYHSPDERRRWRERLGEAEPWIVQLFRRRAGDPSWRDQVVDASAIEVPALCFAGWRDLFVEGQVRAYEQMRGPKQLVVGPWMHTAPHESPYEAVGFLSLALRWWDHWLRGVDTGVIDEPPVVLYVLGSDPGWRAYGSWPPGDDALALRTGADATLAEPGRDGRERPAAIGEYRPDPTIGSLSGLWAVVGANGELPLDQHDDDARALCATSEPLPDDLVVAGRPEVTVTLSDASAPAQRLVVRLCDVDPDGRSALVASGAALGCGRVVLHPVAYRVRAGHRLRIAVGDADFPRFWPLADAPTLHVETIALTLPTVAAGVGAPVELPPAEQPDAGAPSRGATAGSCWLVTREPGRDGVEVVAAVAMESDTADGRHRLERRLECRAGVRRESPEAASIRASGTQVVRLQTGERIEVTVTTRMTATALWVRGAVEIDDATVFSRVWESC